MIKKRSITQGFVQSFGAVVLAASLFSLIACASSAGQADIYGGLGQGGDPIPFMTEVRTGRLPNGLAYYILENTMPENRAYLTLAVNAGSVLENDDEQGLAHFVEHMAFNGTRRFPESELINYLRSLGMRFGPEVNAYTSYDETIYGIEVPTETNDAGAKRIPDQALAIIDDWTYAITFAPKDVDDERPVIMEEYRARLGSDERIRRKMLPLIFMGSPYADRLPIGLPEIFQNAPAERLEHFYKTWYRPDNMAVILVGDFDGAFVEAELASHFSAPAPAEPLQRPVYELPAPKKNSTQIEIITDPEAPFVRIDLFYKQTPLPRGGDLASYRNGVIDNLIDQMIALRFDEAATKQETPYVAAGAGAMRFGNASRYYTLSAIAKPGKTRDVVEALLREKESISRYGFTEAEIDRAKRSLISAMARMVSEKDRRESNVYLNDFVEHFLHNQNTADIEWELNAVTRLLPAISGRDITAAAKDYFAAGDLRLFIAAPEAEASNLPQQAEIQRLVAESKRARIPRPAPAAAAQTDSLLDAVPLPGAIIEESLDEETGAVYWELSNGARVILQETQNKNNEIVLYSMARGGVSSVPEEESISALLAPEMLEASGLGPYTRTEVMQKLAGKQVSISTWASWYYRGVQGFSTAEDVKTLFEMIYLGFTDPRIDPDAVEAMLDQYRTILAQRDEDPNAVFSDELTRVISSNHPRFKPLELADISRVNTAYADKFVRDSLNPEDYTFIFAGNLNLEALRTHVETYLASIPPGAVSRNTWVDLKITRPGKMDKFVYKGMEEQSIAFLGWYAPAPDLYSEADSIAADILTEYLNIVLIEEIREKMGGVYSIQAAASIGFIPAGERLLVTSFAADPNRILELSAAIEELFQKIAGGDIKADVLEKAREARKKSWEESIQNNGYIAQSYANSMVLLETPLSRLYKQPQLYDTVGSADLRRAMGLTLQNGPVRVILYPENRQ
ncbi:MAG: insulinase family protein [Treponema sp.]|jgi:zinc protease|nr:insulinase family protein [Treponema sp.]